VLCCLQLLLQLFQLLLLPSHLLAALPRLLLCCSCRRLQLLLQLLAGLLGLLQLLFCLLQLLLQPGCLTSSLLSAVLCLLQQLLQDMQLCCKLRSFGRLSCL
jgi:hypothetical protein